MLPYILLILLLPVLQGCLVVQTPKCECPILALSSSNIAQLVGDHAFYKNVSGYPMTTPVVKSEDCSVSMYCEGDYTLVLFDKETVTLLGAYSADGICNPRTQKWQVATSSGAAFTSFDRLFGICVDYTPTKCECPVLAMSFSNIAENVGNNEFYQNVSGYPMTTPVVTSEECAVSMYCEGDYSLVMFDEETATVFGAYSADGICDPRNQKWQVDTGSGAELIPFKRLFGVCVNYKPACACSLILLTNDIARYLLSEQTYNWERYYSYRSFTSKPKVMLQDADCPVNFQCEEGYKKLMVFDEMNDLGSTVTYKCDSEKGTWEVRDPSNPGPFRDISFLAMGCYDATKNNTDIIPTAPSLEDCNCRMELLDLNTMSLRIGYRLPLDDWNIDYTLPIGVTKDQNGCVTSIECAANQRESVVFYPYPHPYSPVDGVSTFTCDHNGNKTWLWSIDNEPFQDKNMYHLFLMCRSIDVAAGSISFPTYFPPIEPPCKCSAGQYARNFSLVSSNFLLRTEISLDRCSWTVTCGSWQNSHGQLQVLLDEEFYQSDVYKADCNRDTNQWKIQDSGTNTWDNIKFFGFMCLE